MEDFTKISLCGQAEARPDLSETAGPNARPTASFWLRIVRRWQGRVTNDVCEDTLFVRCHCIGYQANSAKKYVLPGVRVMVEGYLRSLTAPDENGQARTEYFVQVEHLAYLSPREVMEASTKATP